MPNNNMNLHIVEKREPSCGSERRRILDDLLFSDLAEHDSEEETPPVRRTSRRSPSSIKRSLQNNEGWVACDWEVMEQECFADCISEKEADKLLPLFDDDDDETKESTNADHAAPDQAAPKTSFTRHGSIYEVILKEDSHSLKYHLWTCKTKQRRQGNMEETVCKEGQQLPLHFFSTQLIVPGKSVSAPATCTSRSA